MLRLPYPPPRCSPTRNGPPTLYRRLWPLLRTDDVRSIRASVRWHRDRADMATIGGDSGRVILSATQARHGEKNPKEIKRPRRFCKPLVRSSNLSPGTGTLHLGSPFGVGQCPRPGSDLPRPLSQYRTDRAGPCRRNTRPSGRAHPELAGRARSPVKSPKYPQSPASSLVLWDLVHALRIMAHYGVCNTSEI